MNEKEKEITSDEPEKNDVEPSGNDKKEAEGNYTALGISLGLCLGAGLCLVFDNLAMGIGIGMCLGVAVGAALDAKNKK